MKCKVWEFYARGVVEFPRILLGRERGNLRYARLGLIKWLMYSPRKTTSRIPRSDLEVCCKCRRFIFEQIFVLKIDDRYVLFLVLFFSRKIGILSFVAKTNWWYAVKIERLIRFVGCNDGKIHQLVPFTRYRDRVTWCFYCGKMGKAILGQQSAVVFFFFIFSFFFYNYHFLKCGLGDK